MTDSDVRQQLLKLGVDPDQVLREALATKLRESHSGASTPSSRKKQRAAESGDATTEEDPNFIRSLPLAQQQWAYLEKMIKPTSIGRRPRSWTTQGSCSQSTSKKHRRNSQTEWKVEKLLDVRVMPAGEGLERRQFLVRWEGFGAADDEWVEDYNLSQAYDLYPCADQIELKLNSLLKP